MPIPKNILDVERPVNTVVIAYGKNKDRFAVRQRVGCRYVNGRSLPVNGPTIGHIIDGKFVPLDEISPVREQGADMKDWGNVVYCDMLFKDILSELLAVYNRSDALKIYCIAILRVCYPGIKDYELKDAYEESFLSELYPDAALSRNTVSEFFYSLGRAYSRIVLFMQNRAKAISLDHHILIDGTLKSNESEVNSLSNFSRKARTKGTRDISVLFAFDLELKEPICSACYPGNMIDATSYEDFVVNNQITKGLLIGDKGFPFSKSQHLFEENRNLHYMNPLKRNAKVISSYRMYDYDGILSYNSDITYKKAVMKGGKYLYSFRDSRKAAKEEKDYLIRRQKNGDYSDEEFKTKQEEFGTIVLESDVDLDGETAYKAYSSRWEIELVMRYYKQACELDETREHADYSVHGSELCSFLASLLTFRLINNFDKVKLLNSMTFRKAMSILERAKKVNMPGKGWQLIKLVQTQIDILKELGLIPKAPASDTQLPKRKRGRPRKNPAIV
jgi:hypothetical protein